MTDPITPLDPTQTLTAEEKAAHEIYAHRILVGFDQFINCVTGGDLDETISARSGRAAEQHKTWGVEMSRFLNIFQKNHSAKAQAGDLERAQTVINLEIKSGGVDNGGPQVK